MPLSLLFGPGCLLGNLSTNLTHELFKKHFSCREEARAEGKGDDSLKIFKKKSLRQKRIRQFSLLSANRAGRLDTLFRNGTGALIFGHIR
jgi:hypothetical protein